MPDQHNEIKTRILAALTPYFGASAPWVLTQAERRAASLADLPDLLANALPDARRRQEFLTALSWLKQEAVAIVNTQPATPPIAEQKQNTFTGMPGVNTAAPHLAASNAATPLTRLSISLAERRLAQFIGDTAIGMSQSLVPVPQTLLELYECLASKINHDEHKKHFLSLCPGRNADA